MSEILQDRRYVSSHEWVKLLPGHSATRVAVGITAHAQAQLGDVVYVQLPTLGRHYAAGETCAVIESVKAAADVYSPLAGCVLAINSGLSETPELINQDPYTAGWLFELELAADATLDSLLDAAGYAALTASE